jgi:hypothetical protein
MFVSPFHLGLRERGPMSVFESVPIGARHAHHAYSDLRLITRHRKQRIPDTHPGGELGSA